MKTFIFTYYTSTEPLAKIKAEDLEEAILKAAEMKRLSIEEFIQIFKVIINFMFLCFHKLFNISLTAIYKIGYCLFQ